MKPWYKRFLRGNIRLGGGGGGGGAAASLDWFDQGDAFGPFSIDNANQVAIVGFLLPYALTFSNIGVFVSTADAANNYDIGIYTKAGVLVADIGAQPLPAAAEVSFPTVQGTQTIAAGRYLFAMTGDAVIAVLWNDADAPAWVLDIDVAASVGGALPPNIGAVAIAAAAGKPFLYLF